MDYITSTIGIFNAGWTSVAFGVIVLILLMSRKL
jgi:hypothetical protein